VSLNITVASPKLIICATDRRLTDGNTRKIVTERSTKLTMLRCIDALALIAYNGIGRFEGKTPSDWLQELDGKIGLTKMRFRDVLESIRQDVQQRINRIPKQHRRHTFALGVWGQGRTWICVISNYERAGKGGRCDTAGDQFEISVLPQNDGMETRALATGSTQDVDLTDFRKIVQVAKKAGAEGKDIKNLCVAAIQKTAHRRNTGPVGSSVLWAIAERHKDVEGGLDVLGGTEITEIPNMITPGVHMKDIRIGAPKGEPLLWGKPFPLPEELCKSCRNPVPLGYRICPVCGTNAAR
jgi:hypothetical protein